jgi:hypothetical protein
MGRQGREAVKKVWGVTEEGFPDTPTKVSNVQLARIAHADEQGCAFCFPHGSETRNSTLRKNRRSWKHYRPTRYRPKPSA